MIEQELKALIIERYSSIREFSVAVGIPYTTLDSILKRGVEKANVLNIVKICHVLGVDVTALASGKIEEKKDISHSVFSIEEETHIKKYRSLDGYGRDMVDTVLDKEHARCADLKAKREHARRSTEESAEIGAENVLYVVSRYASPMSAGTGMEAGQEAPEEQYLVKAPPRGTSYIAPVRGDSMEPTYSDGDLLFIRATPEIEAGQVGVFLMGGQQWVKELGEGELISHNEEYEPIPMTEDIICQGLVLGVCDESYFA